MLPLTVLTLVALYRSYAPIRPKRGLRQVGRPSQQARL